MTLNERALLRLTNQGVSALKMKKPVDVVAWMGAMQAQDYSMARWAVGVRLRGASNSAVQQAIDRGEIIRTHVMRPTWHLVSSSDASWMIDLTAPRIKATLKSRHRELELTPASLKKSLGVIEKALSAGLHLTREELVLHLTKNKIATHDQRTPHILLWAELEKVICSGACQGKKNTYALFDNRVKEHKKIARDEALARLATAYFQSHGPATAQDFTNWSALSKADGKRAIEIVRAQFHMEVVDSQTYWFQNGKIADSSGDTVYLLPAFDEFIIGYKDRSACLPQKHKSVVISINGIFWPVIVLNGQVIGIWKKTTLKTRVQVEMDFFSKRKSNAALKKSLDEAASRVADFFTD